MINSFDSMVLYMTGMEEYNDKPKYTENRLFQQTVLCIYSNGQRESPPTQNNRYFCRRTCVAHNGQAPFPPAPVRAAVSQTPQFGKERVLPHTDSPAGPIVSTARRCHSLETAATRAISRFSGVVVRGVLCVWKTEPLQ